MPRKVSTNPISTPAKFEFDPLQFYRSPLLRTFAGYKFLSSTFLVCGTLAVPALLFTGAQEGIIGAVAVGVASILPMTAQMVMVPRYVARMRLMPPSTTSIPVLEGRQKNESRVLKKQSKAESIDLLGSLALQSQIRIEYFTLFGMLKSTTETITDLKPHRGIRWINWKSSGTKLNYYVDRQVAGPVLQKIFRMIEEPDTPEKWR